MITVRKPQLVLLPGLLCDATVWKGQLDAFGSLFECHVPDYGLCNSITAMAELTLAGAAQAAFCVVGIR